MRVSYMTLAKSACFRGGQRCRKGVRVCLRSLTIEYHHQAMQ